MVGTNNFKKGLKISIKGEPYVIINFQHVKPGKGNQFTRTKLKNLVKGSQIELAIRSGEKFEEPDILYKDMNFLYKSDNDLYFMDNTSYEQVSIDKELIGTASHFLKENTQAKMCLFNGKVIGIELPKTVELKITETGPGVKGNTVSNATKLATVETGYSLQVPLYLDMDDRIKINTSDGSYIERVKIRQ